MNSNNSFQKGRELEIAVERIENAILKKNPSIKNGVFKIERGKIIVEKGIKFEIDLYVEYNLGLGHKSVYIFECKNWKSKVPTKEINHFANKIDTTKAQIGYFIAKDYTRDSINQAKLYPRMELLYAKDNNVDISPFPNMHVIGVDTTNKHTDFKSRKSNNEKSFTKKLELNQTIVIFQGKQIDLEKFLKQYFDSLRYDRMKNEPTNTFPEGVYKYSAKKKIDFNPGELKIDDRDMFSMEISVEFNVKVIKPIVKSKFDIQKRGRIITFESMEPFPGGNVNISLIESI